MKRRKLIIGLVLALVLALGWYWFRPELLFINSTVNETLPGYGDGDPVILAQGQFHSVSHESHGTATIYQLANGKRVLRLSQFETSNGPDVRVLLVAASDADDNAQVEAAGSIDLGSLKGNRGDQNYELPADVDLTKYRATTIWCRRFSVNFATAPLASIGA
jgi:hypothetical protein